MCMLHIFSISDSFFLYCLKVLDKTYPKCFVLKSRYKLLSNSAKLGSIVGKNYFRIRTYEIKHRTGDKISVLKNRFYIKVVNLIPREQGLKIVVFPMSKILEKYL